MATYLLVHGGFTDGAYWDATASALRRVGHRVAVAELPSTGTDPASLGGRHEDAAEVRRMLDEAAEPVVLVGHSSGRPRSLRWPIIPASRTRSTSGRSGRSAARSCSRPRARRPSVGSSSPR